MARWFIYSVLLAVVPIGIGLVGARLIDSAGTAAADVPTWMALLAQGEGLLAAATICGAAVGEVLGRPAPVARSPLLQLGVGLTLVLALVCALIFAWVSAVSAAGGGLDPDDVSFVAGVSLWLLVLAVASSGSCIGLSHDWTGREGA